MSVRPLLRRGRARHRRPRAGQPVPVLVKRRAQGDDGARRGLARPQPSNRLRRRPGPRLRIFAAGFHDRRSLCGVLIFFVGAWLLEVRSALAFTHDELGRRRGRGRDLDLVRAPGSCAQQLVGDTGSSSARWPHTMSRSRARRLSSSSPTTASGDDTPIACRYAASTSPRITSRSRRNACSTVSCTALAVSRLGAQRPHAPRHLRPGWTHRDRAGRAMQAGGPRARRARLAARIRARSARAPTAARRRAHDVRVRTRTARPARGARGSSSQ